ncbi:MAG TPA: hypothetical protein VGL82_19015 [Bryobacteraceae bacterium]
MKATQILTTIAVSLVLFTSTAGASTLYGTDYNPGSVSSFYSVNTSTGVITRVGSTNVTNLGDLTSDQISTIWSVQITTDDLVTINPITGAGTLGPTMTGTGLSSSAPIASLAWDPATGVLYGSTSVGYGATADTLYSINPTTGAATLIGKIGFADVYSLGFTQDGTLWGVETYDPSGTLIDINTATGAGTSVGNTNVYGVYDIASDPATNILYAVENNTFALYKLNVATAVAADVGFYQSFANIAGLTFLTIGLGAISFTRLRKKRLPAF